MPNETENAEETESAEVTEFSDWLSILLDFYENEEAAEWLVKAHELLDDESPFDVIRDGRQSEVVELVDQMAAGAYV